LISSGTFTGVALADVLELAGVSSRARGLSVLGLDGFPAYLPIDVREQGALLVTHHGDQPLGIDHGAPVRLMLPGRYGMFNIKWLDSITATREYATYGSLGQLATFVASRTELRSRIDTVTEARVGEVTTVSGLAVTSGASAQAGTGVTRVQLHDGRGWRDAALTWNRIADPNHTPFLWTLWSTTWVPERAGEHTLQVRAWDGDGERQDDAFGFPYDAGAIHVVRVRVAG
jgi:DMSO/TMAO reductase YedYZ molybdopterin-dependent catalytic subunit